MLRALQLAWSAPTPAADDHPVAAVLYDHSGTEIAAACHDRDRIADPTAHAEITALRDAGHKLGTWRLDGCTLVTTLEPCTMCAGALVLARISRLVIGAWDDHHGAICSLWDVVRDRRLNHFVEVIPDVLASDCNALLHAPTPQTEPPPAPDARLGDADAMPGQTNPR